MRNAPLYLVLVWVSLVSAGCTRAIVRADNPAPIKASEYRGTFEAAIQVLRDNGFTIDRRDYRFGRITTRPLGSPNLFEVWNTQNTTRHQAVESTLASERRRVNVIFTGPPGDADDTDADTGYTFKVEVVLERKQIPTRRLAGSARRNVFSNLAAPPRDLIDRGVTGSYWQPVGPDPYLEARLIKQIEERVGVVE
jgi:hypothetical protein